MHNCCTGRSVVHPSPHAFFHRKLKSWESDLFIDFCTTLPCLSSSSLPFLSRARIPLLGVLSGAPQDISVEKREAVWTSQCIYTPRERERECMHQSSPEIYMYLETLSQTLFSFYPSAFSLPSYDYLFLFLVSFLFSFFLHRLSDDVAFVGAGVMAFALARGFTDSDRVKKEDIYMVVRNDTKRALVEDLGYNSILDPTKASKSTFPRCFSLSAFFTSMLVIVDRKNFFLSST